MKRLIVFSVPVLVIITTSIFFLGCPGEGQECPAPTGSEHFYVSFTLDGTEIEPENVVLIYGMANKGYDGPEITVFQDFNSMAVMAWSCPYGAGGSFKFCFNCELNFDTRGEYIGTYSDQGITIGQLGELNSLEIKEGGQLYYYDLIDGSVTITAFGDVGGDVIGTLNLTFQAGTYTAPSYGLNLTAIGQFCVKRVADSNRFF